MKRCVVRSADRVVVKLYLERSCVRWGVVIGILPEYEKDCCAARACILRTSMPAAARELDEQNIIRLSAQEQRQFVALLLDPPKLNKVLKRAAAAHTKLIKR